MFNCLNFWDEAWWFLSLRVFGQLSSSLLLFPQRFGRSSKFREGFGVRQTLEEGRLKRCGNKNKDEDNCPKTLNDRNNK